MYDGTSFTSIDYPGASMTNAYDINNDGTIVGRYRDVKVDHGYVFDGTSFTSIDFPGASTTYAVAINDSGSITGYYVDAIGTRHGFIASVVPEPISSILFVTGGSLLAGRSFIKRKKIA